MRNATNITILLDRSGSMASIKEDTIGGVNSFINDQKAVPGDCSLTLVQFDTVNAHEVLYTDRPIKDATLLSDESFTPRGGTPLYDAIGVETKRLGERLKALPEDDRPDKVLFVIVTDGEENSSVAYSSEYVKSIIELQTNIYKWQFLFIGANQDAILAANKIGIMAGASLSTAATAQGTQRSYAAMSHNVASYRLTNNAADLNWTKAQRDEQEEELKKQNAGSSSSGISR